MPADGGKRLERLTKFMDKDQLKEFTEALHAPVVYDAHGRGWEADLPKHISETMDIRQRLELVAKGEWNRATDAEVVCYLFPASLAAPLGGDWTDIYLYETAKIMPQLRDVLESVPEKLSDYQQRELNDLKFKIRNSQIKRRKEYMNDKLKVVIEEGEGKTLVAIVKDGCDPVMEVIDGEIKTIIETPGLLWGRVEKTLKQWETAPKYPAYQRPELEKKPVDKPKAKTSEPAKHTSQAAPGAKTEELPLLGGQKETPKEAPLVEPPSPVIGKLESGPQKVEAKDIVDKYVKSLAGRPSTDALWTEFVRAEALPAEQEVEAIRYFTQHGGEYSHSGQPVTQQPVENKEESKPPAATVNPEPEKPAEKDDFEYFLPGAPDKVYPTVQEVMDALGMDKVDRPHHNRWLRLSTEMREKIQRRVKVAQSAT